MNSLHNVLNLPRAPARSPALDSDRPSRLRRLGAAVWQFFHALGRSRARREMLALADRWQADPPELATQLRRASLDSCCV